jgi:LacI family fructose operon transcriptional repressor
MGVPYVRYSYYPLFTLSNLLHIPMALCYSVCKRLQEILRKRWGGVLMVKIKDVAAAAGVSTATVSRVLSDHPHVRSEVRERVLAAVAELEYQPNLLARSFRAQQTNTIGLILSDIRNPFFAGISRAVEDIAYEHGMSVILCNTDENPEREALYLDLMRAEQVPGVIMSSTGQIARLADLNLDVPVVLVDRAFKIGDVDAVLLDNVSAAAELTTHLLERGYRRIAALIGDTDTTGRERRRGYEAALREYGLAPLQSLIKIVPPRIDAGCTAAIELLQAAQPPDAILAGNSLLTAGALLAIRECNLRIPRDVAVVGFDETLWASLVEPAITTMAQPTHEIGKTATELLLQRIAEPQRPARKVILQGELHVRASSAAKVQA